MRHLVGATCLVNAGGIGDQLMLTTVARELKRRGCRRVLILCHDSPALYLHNRDVDATAILGSRAPRWVFTSLAGNRNFWLEGMIKYDPLNASSPPPEPSLAYMCRKAGITGWVDLRPYITLSGPERTWGATYRGCIAIQSSCLGARLPQPNKEWFPERFAEVAAHLIRSYPVVQVGSPGDPAVPCTHDLRGRTSLRQLAALLAHCRMYVGPEGMLMHMARAVDCPSVIVYGGHHRPDQFGYSCNENLYNPVACAPCWLVSRCDFGRICMETITTGAVIAAAERMLARPREGLAVESYEIGPVPIRPAGVL
jgi:ADP-heptose:LPS heptosyltransferase